MQNPLEAKQVWNIKLWLHNDESWYTPFYEICEQAALQKISISEAVSALVELIPSATPDGYEVGAWLLLKIINEEVAEMQEVLEAN